MADLSSASNPTTSRTQGMLCPVCRVDLVLADRQGIEIDYCPQCRGIWLDRGELDKIIERLSFRLSRVRSLPCRAQAMSSRDLGAAGMAMSIMAGIVRATTAAIAVVDSLEACSGIERTGTELRSVDAGHRAMRGDYTKVTYLHAKGERRANVTRRAGN